MSAHIFSHYSFYSDFNTTLIIEKVMNINRIFLLMAITCFCSCKKKSNNPTPPPVNAPEFMVDQNKMVSSGFVGFGTQYNNNLYTTLSGASDGVTPQNLINLEDKVKKLGSQHIRIFFDCKSWMDYPKYNSEFMPSFIRTVQLAQASGASINLTYWHGAYDDLYEETGTWPMSRQMNDFANVINHLIVDLGLTSVQYITIQNEVNTTSCTKENYVAAYRNLDEELKAKGIRNRVKLIAGDLLVDELKDSLAVTNWITYFAATINDIVDGYSVHLYWNYGIIDEIITRMKFAFNTVSSLPANQQKPIFVMEYSPTADWRSQPGAFAPGFINGTTTRLDSTNEYALIHAWFQVFALNYKYVGFCKWDCYKAKYDNGTQYFSEIGIASEGYPIRPSYYVTWLFTHTCQPGWDVVETKQGNNVNKVVAVMRENSGQNMTVYLVNRSSGMYPFVTGGLPAKHNFHVVAWNNDQKGKIEKLADVSTDENGVLRINLQSQSVVAVTTLEVNISQIS
ncbi:MAG TPA: hypothetical protein VIL78_12110 [Hanamia sp.]|jgi:hypothetical protein